MRYGMVIITSRCVGCDACMIACKQANATPPGVFWTRVYTAERGTYPRAELTFLPALCMHCKNPACVAACPTGASSRNEKGVVSVDKSMCIGCRSCMAACPYNARYFNFGAPASYYPEKGLTPYEQARLGDHVSGTVGKCDFCQARVAAGEQPACVQTCITGCRVFGDLDDPASEVSRLIVEQGAQPLHPELGTEPSVYYILS